MLRADQLRRGGMPAAAQEVAQHLLDFGVTDPALVEPAAELLMSLGMSRSRTGTPGAARHARGARVARPAGGRPRRAPSRAGRAGAARGACGGGDGPGSAGGTSGRRRGQRDRRASRRGAELALERLEALRPRPGRVLPPRERRGTRQLGPARPQARRRTDCALLDRHQQRRRRVKRPASSSWPWRSRSSASRSSTRSSSSARFWPRTAGTMRSAGSPGCAPPPPDRPEAGRAADVRASGPADASRPGARIRRGRGAARRLHPGRPAAGHRPALEPPPGADLGGAAGSTRGRGGVLAGLSQGPRNRLRPHARGTKAGPGPGLDAPRRRDRRLEWTRPAPLRPIARLG